GLGGDKFDTKTIAISVGVVNHAPQNTVPGQQSVNEDTNLTFSSPINQISVTDPEATPGNLPVRVTLSVAHGVLTFSSPQPGPGTLTYVTGDGTQDSTIVVEGTTATINNALNGMIYRANQDFNGTDALVITTNDLGNSGGAALSDTDSVSIVVNPVNDAPVVTVNTPAGGNTALEDSGPFTFNAANSNAITVADVDNPTAAMNVTLTVVGGSAVGTLTLGTTSGLTF